MDSSHQPYERFSISGIQVAPGETREIYLKVSESFLANTIQIPVTVIRGSKPGPTAFVIAAVHGDEINGVDIVRRLIFDIDHENLSGTLIAVPVVNIPGFLTQTRYLPYHRDLNRFFPGKRKGNNAERFAERIFNEIIVKCDFGIDLHTAADGRLNLPHVRGDMGHPRARKLARAFGATVLVDQKGTRGTLRREATEAGVPTILFEAGETGRFSNKISLIGLKGVLNVLSEMKMWPAHKQERPPFQIIVKSSDWVRTDKGGILDLSTRPGDLVYKGDLMGTILNPFGKTVTQIRAPETGIVIGVTTAPLSIPGTGIAHIAKLKKTLSLVERSIARESKKRSRKTGKPLRSKRQRVAAAGGAGGARKLKKRKMAG
jgi:predicted deacylase